MIRHNGISSDFRVSAKVLDMILVAGIIPRNPNVFRFCSLTTLTLNHKDLVCFLCKFLAQRCTTPRKIITLRQQEHFYPPMGMNLFAN